MVIPIRSNIFESSKLKRIDLNSTFYKNVSCKYKLKLKYKNVTI